MKLEGFASKCGIPTVSVSNLLKAFVDDEISTSLKIRKTSLQIFLDGGTCAELASKLGVSSSDLQELRNEIEREGAIGMIIGLMVKESIALESQVQ